MSLRTRTTSTNTVVSDDERAFAEGHRVAHLATADAAGAPHVIPICYALIGDAFYFVVDEKPKRTRTGLKRLRNIAANPQVALVIDDYDEDWTRLAYLLVRGRAALVEEHGETPGARRAPRALPAVSCHAAELRHASDGAHRLGAATPLASNQGG